MNLNDLIASQKEVAAAAFFKSDKASATAIRIKKEKLLKEHITKTPAVLICITGDALFENERGLSIQLKPGDFLEIEPHLKHWVKGIEDSLMVLVS